MSIVRRVRWIHRSSKHRIEDERHGIAPQDAARLAVLVPTKEVYLTEKAQARRLQGNRRTKILCHRNSFKSENSNLAKKLLPGVDDNGIQDGDGVTRPGSLAVSTGAQPRSPRLAAATSRAHRDAGLHAAASYLTVNSFSGRVAIHGWQ